MEADPLFGNLDALSGPTSVYVYQHTDGSWVYLLGENHDMHGDLSKPALLDVLIEHRNAVHVIIEKGVDEVLLAANHMKSNPGVARAPLAQLAHHHVYGQAKEFMSFTFADMRRQHPYHILEAVYGFGSYLQIHKRNIVDSTEFLAFRKRIKLFEKDVYKHISTRKQCRAFLNSMAFPDKPFPAWYSRWLEELSNANESSRPSLKTLLAQYSDAPWYGAVYEYVNDNWEAIVDRNGVYSAAMDRVAATRRTDSPNMVTEKYDALQTYFAILFGILMEAYILIKVQTLESKIKVILVGSDHCQRLKEFFSIRNGYEPIYQAHALQDGYIDLVKHRDKRLRVVGPTRALHAFARAHQEKHKE